MVSSQKPWVWNASCSASLVPCGTAAPAAAPRCSRSPQASGTITIDMTPRIIIVVCQSSSRFCSSEASGTMANWPNEPPEVVTPSAMERLLAGVWRAMAPKIGPKPAAAMPMPHRMLPSVSITPSCA